jgi:hypothetical protein
LRPIPALPLAFMRASIALTKNRIPLFRIMLDGIG